MIRLIFAVAASAMTLSACDTAPVTQTFVIPAPSRLPTAANVAPAVQTDNGVSVAPANAPSGPVVDQFAVKFLNTIQAKSIRERREYCGYFLINRAGQLTATQPRPGTFASCDLPAPRRGQGIIASYHTHGAYGRQYDNEVPSTVDLMSDFDFGIDGYVSTPGGRVWLVDYQTRSTRQLCGLRCVTSDPGFVPQGEAGIQQRYDLPALRRRTGQ